MNENLPNPSDDQEKPTETLRQKRAEVDTIYVENIEALAEKDRALSS